MIDDKEAARRAEHVDAFVNNTAPGPRTIHTVDGGTRMLKPGEQANVVMTRAEFESTAGMDGMDIQEGHQADKAGAPVPDEGSEPKAKPSTAKRRR